ncbi:MAG: hypothetical protein RMZ42_34355 [Nostoc sp. DedQUE05]|uniref:hypothetical protein n=1 Tax=Nostoc sp. DedQUE05 TaxID=3075391 RepID=UPI002AD40646|nr:hypothetical protein [Nostoc sp. DedQUE05]MDZ8096984.1 hypothetical protein [Nostoc sp. DedQUE05]MDZ8096985.1 hypothetical protein [Nostoc sp. DedQUE05]
MESTLFIELTATEEANLSGGGGNNKIKVKQVVKNYGYVSVYAGDDLDNSGNISSDAVGTVNANIYD